jgi:ABC-type sugar transport system ATPase subunit
VNGVSLDVRYGEILGLAGLVGSGRSEFARTLFGIDAMDAGVIRIDGSVVRIRNPRDALKAGIVLVPEDRKGQGLIMMQSVAFNLSIPWTADWNPGLFPSAVRKRQIVQRAITAFQIKARDPESAVGTLSGGNQQKVLVSRWMEHPPKVLILDEPTRGVDVGAREEMFAIIARLVENGMAVILISSDLLEVMNLSHRVAIYRDGRVLDIVPAGQTTIENVMDRLIGAANDAQDSTVDACLKN